MITLSGCGRTTYWRFPQHTNICPVQRCWIKFSVRSDAIDHYKKKHARHAILCPLCVRPISAPGLKYFKNHYKSVHETEKKLPYGFSSDIEPTVSQYTLNMTA